MHDNLFKFLHVEKFCHKTPNKNHPATFFLNYFGRHARLMQQSQSTPPFLQQPCQFASPILKKLGENTPHMYSTASQPSKSPPLRLPKRQIHSSRESQKKITQQKYGVDCWLRQVVCPSVFILWVLGQIHVQFFLGKGCIFCGLPVEADR